MRITDLGPGTKGMWCLVPPIFLQGLENYSPTHSPFDVIIDNGHQIYDVVQCQAKAAPTVAFDTHFPVRYVDFPQLTIVRGGISIFWDLPSSFPGTIVNFPKLVTVEGGISIGPN